MSVPTNIIQIHTPEDCHMEHKHLYYSGKSENRTVELHTAREHVRWPLHVEVHAVDMG